MREGIAAPPGVTDTAHAITISREVGQRCSSRRGPARDSHGDTTFFGVEFSRALLGRWQWPRRRCALRRLHERAAQAAGDTPLLQRGREDDYRTATAPQHRPP